MFSSRSIPSSNSGETSTTRRGTDIYRGGGLSRSGGDIYRGGEVLLVRSTSLVSSSLHIPSNRGQTVTGKTSNGHEGRCEKVEERETGEEKEKEK